MSKIVFLPRTGKDFFNYIEMSEENKRIADDWAIEYFCLIDGKKLNIEDISKLSARAYLQISSKIFASKNTQITELGLEVGDITIPFKPLHRDFIAQMQTQVSKNKGTVALLKYCIVNFFDISIDKLMTMPYEVACGTVSEINNFLTSLATSQDEFDIDDVWNSTT